MLMDLTIVAPASVIDRDFVVCCQALCFVPNVTTFMTCDVTGVYKSSYNASMK